MKFKRYTKVTINGDPNKEIHEIFRIINEYDKIEYRIRTLDGKPVFQRYFENDLISAREPLLDLI